MPWFRVDDGFALHPKVNAAGNSAIGLWVRAGSWCAQQLTDGFVPAHIITALGGRPKDAASLVGAGLWRTVDGGWQFHDWSDRQPSAESVKLKRAAAVERQRKARDKAAASRGSHATVTVLSQRDKCVSHAPPEPCPEPNTKDYGEVDHHPTVCNARRSQDDDEKLNRRTLESRPA